jgi:hypothetical protein
MPVLTDTVAQTERQTWTAPSVEAFETAPEMAFYCGRA